MRSRLIDRMAPADLTSLVAVAATWALARGEYVWRAGNQANEVRRLSGEVQGSSWGPTAGRWSTPCTSRAISRSSATAAWPTWAISRAELIRFDRRNLGPFLDRHPQVKDRALEGLAGSARWAGSVMASALAAMTG